jgi:hypothetical protein
MFSKSLCLLGLACLTACAPMEDRLSAFAAKDSLMRVRENPPSLGHQRVEKLAAEHPNFADFLRKRGGWPEFIAETSNQDRHYTVLYYLKPQVAYLCRSYDSRGSAAEFRGPYPLTKRELKILRDFKKLSD